MNLDLVGVPPTPVEAHHYFWLQTWGWTRLEPMPLAMVNPGISIGWVFREGNRVFLTCRT